MLAAKHTHTDVLAIAAGVVLAGVLLVGWRVEGGVDLAPAELELVTASSDDVAVTPEGVAAATSRLRPSAPEKAAVRELGVRNASADAIDVRVAATPQTGELSQALRLRVVARGQEVFEGSLADLEQGSGTFPLASGEETTVALHTWIAEDAPAESWAGRSESVRVELETVG